MTLDFSPTARKHLKNEELKRHLIECVNEENSKFITIAENFNKLERRDDQHYLELCNAIIEAVDHILGSDKWDNSLFLRNTMRPLKKIRDHAIELRQGFDGVVGAKKLIIPKVGENCVKLYVSLYQANGHDMKKWTDQLNSLGSYMIGRPVYQREEDIIQAMRKKLSQTSEAYIVVAVDKSKIISSMHGEQRKDKLGTRLVTLVPDAIDTGNILEFVYQSKRYYFRDHQLLLVE